MHWQEEWKKEEKKGYLEKNCNIIHLEKKKEKKEDFDIRTEMIERKLSNIRVECIYREE